MKLISNNEIESEKQNKKFPLLTNKSPELVSQVNSTKHLKYSIKLKWKKYFQTHPTKTRQRPQKKKSIGQYPW